LSILDTIAIIASMFFMVAAAAVIGYVLIEHVGRAIPLIQEWVCGG